MVCAFQAQIFTHPFILGDFQSSKITFNSDLVKTIIEKNRAAALKRSLNDWLFRTGVHICENATHTRCPSKPLRLFPNDPNSLHNTKAAAAINNKGCKLTLDSVILLTQATICQEECACSPDKGTIHLISARHVWNSKGSVSGGRQVLGNKQNILHVQEQSTHPDSEI